MTEGITPDYRGIIATTKPTVLTSGERVVFAREAFTGMIEQIEEHFIPLSDEHLTLFPPTGRIVRGSVEPTEDGYEAFVVEGIALRVEDRVDDADPFAATIEEKPSGPDSVGVMIHVESRNFEDEAWSELSNESPVPVEAVQKWSSLPPIEWLLAIPVTWGAVKFTGSFLERLGASSADGLVSWIARSSNRAKESRRDRFVTLSFDLPDGRRVLGFVPFAADGEMRQVTLAVDDAGFLAGVAGSWLTTSAVDARIVAYLFAEHQWRLAWFVTDDTVFRTPYFKSHMPDPQAFLHE